MIFIDSDRIAQVLDNLLDNAIRYSPAGGEVRLAFEWDADQVACRVTNEVREFPLNTFLLYLSVFTG